MVFAVKPSENQARFIYAIGMHSFIKVSTKQNSKSQWAVAMEEGIAVNIPHVIRTSGYCWREFRKRMRGKAAVVNVPDDIALCSKLVCRRKRLMTEIFSKKTLYCRRKCQRCNLWYNTAL